MRKLIYVALIPLCLGGCLSYTRSAPNPDVVVVPSNQPTVVLPGSTVVPSGSTVVCANGTRPPCW